MAPVAEPIAATAKRVGWNESLAFAVMVLALLIAPLFVYPVFLMKALCFALFACAFNLLIGYVGLLSFGHALFFGFGSYVAAHLAKVGTVSVPYWLGGWKWLVIPLPPLTPELAIVGGALAACVLGIIAGAIAIRRLGIYFAMITLALAQMMYFFALQAPFTGGEDGIQAVPRGNLFGLISLSDQNNLYLTVVVIFLGCFLLIYRIIHSPFGEVLKAIRENEARATSLGYKTDRYKLVAFVLSATLAGVAGATKAIVFQLASLTDVHWTMSGEVVLMTLLGGLGTVYGPVVGAFIVITLENYLAQLGAWVTVVQGAIFVICVLTFRRGVVGELSHLLARSFKMDLIVALKPKQPEQTVDLVMVNSMTGPMALYGRAGSEGAKIAVFELNEAGGVLGRRLHLNVRDDGSSPEVGAREARDAMRLDNPAVMFGPVSSDVLLAMSEVSKDSKTILISHTANSERAFLECGHRYIFSVVPSTFMEGSAMGMHMAQHKALRYVILGPDYEFGHVQAQAFERRLKEKRPDVEIVDRLWIKPGEADHSRHISAIRTARPDAVYCNLYGFDLVTFTRQAKTEDFFNGLAFAALYDVDTLQALGPDAVEGVIAYERGPFHVIRKLAPSPRFEDFIRKYGAATNKYPSAWAISAYDAVMTWAKAVRKADSFDAEKVVDALEGLEIDSLRGPGCVIRRADHQASVGSYIGVVAWDDGFPDFALWKNATYVPGDQVWRPESEIRAARQSAQG
jgi:branched-chain amino acid transport system permease protein